MSCRVLTPGHVKCLEYLAEQDFVVVGLLTSKAMKGYKDEVVPYRDRKYILDIVASWIEDVTVVAQSELSPVKNIVKYDCHAIASGDGWEQVELDAIAKYSLRKIDIKLPGEKTKKYSSSKIINKL